MKLFGKKIPFNRTFEGIEASYNAWEIRRDDIQFAERKDVLCLICYVTLPKVYHILSSHFFLNSAEVHGIKVKHIIYSYIFIPAENEQNADFIHSDIKLLFDKALV